MNRPVILLLIFFLTPLARNAVVVTHELGHALAALLFTRRKVSIVIGSYDEPKRAPQFRSKWIDISFTRQIWGWRSGYFRSHPAGLSVARNVIILLAGSLFPMLAGVALFALAYLLHLDSVILLFSVIFSILAFLGIFNNLIPRGAIYRRGRRVLYNDGRQIANLLKMRKYYDEWIEVLEQCANGRFVEASKLLDELHARHPKDPHLLRSAIDTHRQARHMERAYELGQIYMRRFTADTDDLNNLGIVKGELGLYEESLRDYDNAIEMAPNNDLAWNNRGYTLMLLERYEEAIEDFDEAIRLEPNGGAYAFGNRGFAKVKLGMTEEGLSDIHRSLELDAANSYAHRNLGIYHLEQGRYAEALEKLEKARELDLHTHMVEHYIALAKEGLAIAVEDAVA